MYQQDKFSTISAPPIMLQRQPKLHKNTSKRQRESPTIPSCSVPDIRVRKSSTAALGCTTTVTNETQTRKVKPNATVKKNLGISKKQKQMGPE
jgi:hypothetical protein